MLKRKKLLALLLTCVLICALSVTAFAKETPDLGKTGSLSLTMLYQGKAVSGGTVTAYRVGDVAVNNGNYSFVLSTEFAESEADLSNLSAAGLAQTLADYAEKQKLTGTSAAIGNDGKAEFSGIKLGLYLIVQTKAASGYEKALPFLVSVPMYVDGSYVYDVDATPKITPVKPTPSDPDTPTPTPDTPTPTPDTPTPTPDTPTPTPDTPTPTPDTPTPTPDTPTPTPDTPTPTPDTPTPTPDTPTPTPNTPTPTPDIPKLPQTGQLNWPIPVLAGAGLCLILLGWALRCGKRKDDHET